MVGVDTGAMDAGPTAEAPIDALSLGARIAGSRAVRSPTVVATVVTLVYAALALLIVAQTPAGDFAFVGQRFVSRSGTSATIARHAHATTKEGYDGQFALYIALDPLHAAPSMDKPAYRYSHVLYPLLARAFAIGKASWVSAALIVVNLLSVFFGTLALGLILRRHHLSPALAAYFGFFPGVLVTFNRDLGDLLAYSLVAAGVLALRWDRRNRIAIAGIAFASAALARETTLLFPVILSLFELARGEDAPWRARLARSASLASLAVLPYAVWRLFLFGWLGTHGSVPSGLAPFPFAGVAPPSQLVLVTVIDGITIVAPALMLAFVVLGSGLWRHRSPYPTIVLAQILLLVVFLPAASYRDYFAAGRLQIGTVVAALCCAPVLMTASLRHRQILGIAVVLAMAFSVEFALVMLGGKPV